MIEITVHYKCDDCGTTINHHYAEVGRHIEHKLPLPPGWHEVTIRNELKMLCTKHMVRIVDK